jgi:hypothetical protein
MSFMTLTIGTHCLHTFAHLQDVDGTKVQNYVLLLPTLQQQHTGNTHRFDQQNKGQSRHAAWPAAVAKIKAVTPR